MFWYSFEIFEIFFLLSQNNLEKFVSPQRKSSSYQVLSPPLLIRNGTLLAHLFNNRSFPFSTWRLMDSEIHEWCKIKEGRTFSSALDSVKVCICLFDISRTWEWDRRWKSSCEAPLHLMVRLAVSIKIDLPRSSKINMIFSILKPSKRIW